VALILVCNAVAQSTTGHTQPAGGSGQPSSVQAAPVLPIFLQAITVTATRSAEELKDVPQAVTVLTPWSVQVSAQGSPIVRGQIGNRVLYLWDGIRINNGALFAGPNGFFNQIPLNSVERMEVIRGPGAVQYGSDAIGGVINIFTQRLESFPSALHYGGEIHARYDTVDLEKTSTGNFWLASRRFNLIGGITGQSVDDYRVPGFGIQKNTGFDATGGSFNFGFRPADGHTLNLSWIHERRFDVATYTQSKLNPSGIPRIFGPFEQRGLLKLGYDFDRLSKFSSGLRSYLYYQYYDSARDLTVEASALLNRTRTDIGQRIVGGGVQNTNRVRSHRIVYGVDYRAEDLNSDRTLYAKSKTTGSVAVSLPNGNIPAGDYKVFDAFALTVLRPAARLTVSLGTRLESSGLHSRPRPQDAVAPFTIDSLRLDKRWNSLTWNAGVVYGIKGGLSLATNVAAGFRAPTFSDTLSTGVPVFASGVASVPSPSVKPERSITYEAGPRYVSRNLHFSLTAYSNQLTDLLAQTPAGTIDLPGVGVVNALANANIATAYVRGVEAALAYRFYGPWTLFGNATYTRGQNTRRNVPLRFIPPLYGVVGLRWARPQSRWWAETTTMLADRLRKHAPEDEIDAGFSRDPGFGSPGPTNPPLRSNFSIPGYAVVHLRVGVSIWKDRRRTLDIFTDLNNLFNVRYREAYAQQQLLAPGFGAVIGGRFQF
jgi:outer membrane receptor protein involved in Fe transport